MKQSGRCTRPRTYRASPLLLGALCVPMFLVLLDVLAMNVAQPALGRAFGIPRNEWSLVVDAYTLPLAIGLLPAGWLVDRIGARTVLICGLGLFGTASGLGALGWAWGVVISARVIQGIAAAAMLPAGLAALTTNWAEPAARARALGIWSGLSAVATAIGPGAGGMLVAALDWRAVFWINVPLVLSALRHYAAAARRRAGAILLLATAPFVILGPVAGRLVARHGRRAIAAVGLLGGGLGLLTLGRFCGLAGLVPGLLSIGIGLGLMTAAIVGETMAAWPGRPGLAGGLNNALRQLGTSAGVAIGGFATSQAGGTALLEQTGLAAGLWWIAGSILVLIGFARSPTPRTEEHRR